MNKINFQNGTLVSKAKVTVGGTVYEVEPAEYEGTTPLNAENLNQIQTNVENAIPPVVDNLTSTSATDALSAKQGKILKEIIEGTVLYENSEGTISDIEFDATNYNTFEIYYYSTWNETNRLCIRKCLKNRSTELVSIELLGHAMIENTQVEINDSGMEVRYRRYTYVKVDSGVSYSTDSNEIKISKIIGYK